jgi:hypothetical protein
VRVFTNFPVCNDCLKVRVRRKNAVYSLDFHFHYMTLRKPDVRAELVSACSILGTCMQRHNLKTALHSIYLITAKNNIQDIAYCKTYCVHSCGQHHWLRTNFEAWYLHCNVILCFSKPITMFQSHKMAVKIL